MRGQLIKLGEIPWPSNTFALCRALWRGTKSFDKKRLACAEVQAKHALAIQTRGFVVLAILLLDRCEIDPAWEALAWVVKQRGFAPGVNRRGARKPREELV